MANPKILIKSSKVQKGKTVRSFKEDKPSKSENHSEHVLRLRKSRLSFKVVSGKVERHYDYNGNNYVVTTINAE